MGLKDKLTNSYTQAYLKKYGDRLTQAQGRVLSVKVEEKVYWNFLKIFYKLTVTILVKADGSKAISKCVYNKKRWFKKINFISVLQGQSVIVQGMKGKKGKEHREQIQIVNIRNMTTKKDLVPQKGDVPAQKVQRVRADKRFK